MVAFTMQDAANTLKLMYELNVMPLALQITSIAGKHIFILPEINSITELISLYY